MNPKLMWTFVNLQVPMVYVTQLKLRPVRNILLFHSMESSKSMFTDGERMKRERGKRPKGGNWQDILSELSRGSDKDFSRLKNVRFGLGR